jgi:hypothetical protein
VGVTGETKVEIGRVDKEHRRRPPAGQEFTCVRVKAEDGTESGQDLGDAHQRKLFDIRRLLETCFAKTRPPDSIGFQRRRETAQFLEHACSVEVAGNLPG